MARHRSTRSALTSRETVTEHPQSDVQELRTSVPGNSSRSNGCLPGLTSRVGMTRANRRSPSSRRRGIVLLFVLAPLALFSLVTVTFVIVARQAKISALDQRGGGCNTDNYPTQLDTAMLQLLRGTDNEISVARPHSLLEDMYGNDAVVGTVVSGSQPFNMPANGQVQQFYVQLEHDYTDPPPDHPPIYNPPIYMYDGAYNGRTVTMLTGNAAGISSRVMESMAVPTPAPTATSGPTHGLTVITFGANVNLGDRVLINGAAFNGTGFGYGFMTTPTGPIVRRCIWVR